MPKNKTYLRPEHLKNVARFILAYQAEHAYAPSIREISEHFSDPFHRISTNSVLYWLKCMREEGLLAPAPPGIARALRVIPFEEQEGDPNDGKAE